MALRRACAAGQGGRWLLSVLTSVTQPTTQGCAASAEFKPTLSWSGCLGCLQRRWMAVPKRKVRTLPDSTHQRSIALAAGHFKTP